MEKIKLAIDLFPSQGSNAYRGIGRYTQSLAKHLVLTRGRNILLAMYNAQYTEKAELLRQTFSHIIPPGCFVPYHHPKALIQNWAEVTQKEAIAGSFLKQAYNYTQCDFLLQPSIFEGLGTDFGTILKPDDTYSPFQKTTIVYDLIPYIFSKQYLDINEHYKKWYLDKLFTYKKYDLLFTLSESTKVDLVKYLGIDHNKIINISAGLDRFFEPTPKTEVDFLFLQAKGVVKDFIFYLGGNNFRKNMKGAIITYANLPFSIRNQYQLVINDIDDTFELQHLLSDLGLAENDVIVTGKISDSELRILYNHCFVFFFPSLYEGFGLPILEAMACGAPVICSNNSSMPEIVGRTDCLFDASNVESTTAMLAKVLTDSSFRQNLIDHNLIQVHRFSWQKSATAVWDALEYQHKDSKKQPLFTKVEHRKSKPPIAYVSPLPPMKSGIADYSNELLDVLHKYFDIDLFIPTDKSESSIISKHLTEKFEIFPASELLIRKNNYRTVVYHFGNSDYHTEMFDLLQAFPGVVVLHDFFLSHLRYHASTSINLFIELVNNSHGYKGVIELQKKGVEMIMDWPINIEPLFYATRIISHSGYHKYLAEKFYNRNEVISSVIPQLRRLGKQSHFNHTEVRKSLNLAKTAFIFATFGIVSPYKSNDLILDAFAQVLNKTSIECYLLFVGEFVSDDYRNQIRAKLRVLNIKSKVIFIGYTPDKIYNQYLHVTNVAIQLRTNSRGETSRAILDCLSVGLPTIVNSHGTVDEYPPNVVIKLPATVSDLELANAMLKTLQAPPTEIEQIKKDSINWVQKYHHPDAIASQYESIIQQAIEMDERKVFAPVLKDYPSLTEITRNEFIAYANANRKIKHRPRIFIDVSFTAKIDYRSGIQRVVKNICTKMLEHENLSVLIEPVYLSGGQLRRANKLFMEFIGLEERFPTEDIHLPIAPGDMILMLDSSWHNYIEFRDTFAEIRKNGGKVVTVVYDLIFYDFPEFFSPEMVKTLKDWLDHAIAESDVLLCISKHVASRTKTYIDVNKPIIKHNLSISYFHLGSDLSVIPKETPVRSEVSKLKNIIMFTMVGTIEPRKGHLYVLNAFERLWETHQEIHLCIVGKTGWNVEATLQKINQLKENRQPIIIIDNPTDAEILSIYQNSTALIAASADEGFGLPIVEAALHKLPVLASDIPVFREVGGDGAIYFSLSEPSSLISAIETISKMSANERRSLAERVKVISWKDSAQWVLDTIENKTEHYYTFLANSPADIPPYRLPTSQNTESIYALADRHLQVIQQKQARIQQLLNQLSVERSRGWHNQFLQKLPKPIHSALLIWVRLIFLGRVQAITSHILHEIVSQQVSLLDLLRMVSNQSNSVYRNLETSQQSCKRLLQQYDVERLRGWHNHTLQKLPAWIGKTVRFGVRPFYLGRVQQIESEILFKINYFEQAVAQNKFVS
jgi:glycosyltransferase involved in cell wall biosynthesis